MKQLRYVSDLVLITSFQYQTKKLSTCYEAGTAQSEYALDSSLDNNHGLIPGRQEAIFFLKTSRSFLGSSQLSIQCALCDVAPGAKQPRREAGHSFLSNVNIKNACSYTFSFPHSYTLWTCEFSLYFCTRH
jgi:hypothetical protein